MLTTIELVLAGLKLINLIMGAVNREQWKKAGRDEVIAQTLAEIAEKANAQRTLKEKIDAMSAEEVDAALRDLEPK
jgi:lipid A disaccharide synthetase